MYLKVGPKSKITERRTVDAITNEDSASQFYVKYDRKNGKYFEIFHHDGENQCNLYLSATTDDRRDNRNRSLQVRSDAGGAWSYLSLCNEKLKLVKDHNKWLEGSKSFAISCYVKPAQAAKRDMSYLIIHPSEIQGRERYSIRCMSNSMITYTTESELMQFQLVPVEEPQVEDAQQSQNQQHSFQQQAAAAPTQEGSVTSRKLSVTAEITAASQ